MTEVRNIANCCTHHRISLHWAWFWGVQGENFFLTRWCARGFISRKPKRLGWVQTYNQDWKFTIFCIGVAICKETAAIDRGVRNNWVLIILMVIEEDREQGVYPATREAKELRVAYWRTFDLPAQWAFSGWWFGMVKKIWGHAGNRRGKGGCLTLVEMRRKKYIKSLQLPE